MVLEVLAGALAVVGITHSILEQAIEDGAEWIALDSIGADAAASLNESGLTVGDGVGPYDGIFDSEGRYIG